MFQGNEASAHEENIIEFERPFEAKAVRFNPSFWVYNICMRVEITGYFVTGR